MNLRSALLGVGILGSIGLCLALARPAAGPSSPTSLHDPETFAIDGVHSSVVFRIKHQGVSYIYGRFDEISGSLTIDSHGDGSKANVEIKTASIDTGNEKRDGHLKSPDFFDAKQFPTATFASKSVKAAGTNKFGLTGDLSLHGVTKPVTIDMEVVGQGKGMQGEQLIGFLGTLTIKRSDFGIKFAPDTLGDDVQVTLSIQAGKK